MRDVIAHEEKLVSGVAIVSRVEDAIVAYESLEVEAIFWVTLDPTVQWCEYTEHRYGIVYGVYFIA
jgi:hypothetical protein